MKSWLVMVVLTCMAMLVQAQGVYVTQGEHGPVFSDKPQAGAKEVTLRPLSVIEAPRETSAAASKAAVPSPARSDSQRSPQGGAAYQSLAILSPENESSVIINTGAIDVRLTADPSLQLGEGHAFAVSVNGRDVGQRYTASEFIIPPEFWGGNPPINQFAQLDVSIVEASGRVLIRATPVRFLMRYTTVLNNPNYHHSLTVIRPSVPMIPLRPAVPVTSPPAQKPSVEKAPSTRTAVGRIDR